MIAMVKLEKVLCVKNVFGIRLNRNRPMKTDDRISHKFFESLDKVSFPSVILKLALDLVSI